MCKKWAVVLVGLLMLVWFIPCGLASETADFLNALANMIDAYAALEEIEARDEYIEPEKEEEEKTEKEASEGAADTIDEKKNGLSGKTVEVEMAGKTVKVHESIKEAMDQYEALFDQYIAIMAEDDPSVTAYANALAKYAEAMEALEAIDEEELTDGDYAYYIEVMMRVNQKLVLVES